MRCAVRGWTLGLGALVGVGLGCPPDSRAIVGGSADFVCKSPSTARDELVDDASGFDTSLFDRKACAKYCRSLTKACFALVKVRVSCHKAMFKRDNASERIECGLETDKEFRTDCNQALHEDLRDGMTSLKDEASVAKDECAALDATCRSDCATGSLFSAP